MKNNNYFRTLLGAFLLGSVITACDKFEDDVPPARMASMQLNNDTFTTLKNQSLQINVLANDTIGGTATLSFGQPQNGTIQTTNNGGVLYQPAHNFTGTDSFTYTACLGNDCASAMVNILVKNDTTNVCAVQAFDDIRTLKMNYADTINVVGNDNLCGIAGNSNNTTVTIIQPPKHGHASVQSYDNKIFYVPTLNYFGQDEITYRITNSKGTSTAKVIFNILQGTPVCYVRANTDSAYISRGALGTVDTVSVKVLTNDILCPNNGPLTLTFQGQSQKQTQYGFFQIVGTGTNRRIIYTTTAGRNFTDFALYNLCQGNSCSTAYVYVHVR